MYDVDHIKATITAAGQIALNHFAEVTQQSAATPAWKKDRTYVTLADLAVQEYLRGIFGAEYPDDGIVAEENELRKPPKSGERYWVIDPIDGTASFSAGLPVWGVSIALVDQGQAVGGFFYIPVTRDFFHTTPEGQVCRNGVPMRMRQPVAFHRETSLFIASRLHRFYNISADYPGKLRNLGSTVAHLGYVATGSADAALVERVYVWDIAAGMAMLEQNGGVFSYLDGAPVQLSPLLAGERMPQPILAGHPDTVASFSAIISYSDGENGYADI